MAEVLLINTPVQRKNKDPNSGESTPPIGLGYIYTQLILAGSKCQFVDAVFDSLLPTEVLEIINNSKADYVGLNMFSSNLNIVRDLVENADTPRKFLLGGPAARALVAEIKSWKPKGDVTVIIGEAELILPKLIEKPPPEGNHSSNLNILDVTPESSFFPRNIDIPLDRTIFKNDPIIRQDLNLIESHIVTSRGCPYDCAYCTAAISCNPGTKPRYRTQDSLYEEIENIQKSHPEIGCIRILDDLFLRNPKSIELATKLFPGHNLYWRSMAHINTFRGLSSQSLSDIKKSGCRELFLGIESGNDATLKHIRKPFSADTAHKTICRILDAGIPVKCYFILGFPGETEAASKDTLNFASRLREYADTKGVQLRISPFRFRPYHGTALYDELIDKGRTIKQIQNRLDISDSGKFNPYDCVSENYADYDTNTLDHFMDEMEKLNSPA